ncbi:MAG: sugar transporter ATP-binding protein [Chloroflexi bacterium]|jgi:multiple sugar transport system ATP-binding protein|nr:sugar transporter ATP-binding protein [Chloroflexota bacterium]
MSAAMTNRDQLATHNQNIRLVDAQKRFGNHLAVKNLNLEIIDRELLVVLGPSGCGKSTTLNLLAGLERPTNGQIYFGNEDVTKVPAEERNVSVVFQSITLYPHKNVQENILFALKLAKVPRDVQEQRLRETARLLGIDRYLSRRIHQLSGGERQRVAIAKALVKRPRLFILDEPFSSLDAELRRELRGEIVRIHRELQTTMLFVTHDQEEALSIADRIALMKQGELVQLGPALDIYEKPATSWVASFVGPHRINLLDVELGVDGDQPYVQTPAGRLLIERPIFNRVQQAASSQRVMLGLRPEFSGLSASATPGHSLPVEVYTRQHLGNEVLYHVKTDNITLRAVVPATQHFQFGDLVNFEISWNQALWFDSTSGQLLHAPSLRDGAGEQQPKAAAGIV